MFRLPSSFRHPAAELILKLSVSFSFFKCCKCLQDNLKQTWGRERAGEGCHRHSNDELITSMEKFL